MIDAEIIRHEKDLVMIFPKNPELYNDISLAALTVYSLYWLLSVESMLKIRTVRFSTGDYFRTNSE